MNNKPVEQAAHEEQTGKRRLSAVKERLPAPGELTAKVKQSTSGVQENPVALGLVSGVLGFAAGMLIPVTRYEAERMPALAGQAKQATDRAVKQAQQTSTQAAAGQLETRADQAIDAVAEQAKKIPGAGEAVEKAEEAARHGVRRMADRVAEKDE